MMNWTTSDTIAAAIPLLTFLFFFLEDTSIFHRGYFHMAKRAFSALTNVKTKYWFRLNVESDLQVCLSQIARRIDELCQVKQAHHHIDE